LYEPNEITKKYTPVILIHGSGSNQRQFDIFRKFLQDEKYHIFSVALNERPFSNDKKTVAEYANSCVKEKLNSIKQKYLDSGLNLDEVILLGHSMGGLIAGEFALSNDTVKVKHIITMSTPWYGSKMADLKYSINSIPESIFLTESPELVLLREKIVNSSINIYTFSSTFDPLVRPHSSNLEIAESNKILSTWHDHYSPMFDPFLAYKIKKDWIVPNINLISSVSSVDNSYQNCK